MMTKNEDQQMLQNGFTTKTPAIICNGMDQPLPYKPLGERRRAVLRQELMVLLGNLGIIGAGMAIALPSVTLEQLRNPTEKITLNSDESSWFSSLNTMSSPLGGLLVGYLLDRIGRKYTILVMNLVGLLGWALLAAAPLHNDREAVYLQMLAARFLSGVMIGLSISPLGVYSAEISTPKIRSRLILGTSLSIAAGILLMYVLGYFIRNDWQLIAIICSIYQVITTLCVLLIPESPSWLMLKGRIEASRKSLSYFRGLKKDTAICNEFETELALVKKTAELSRCSAESESLLQAIKTPEVFKPLLLMIAFFGFQQCSGIVVVVVFAVQIATQAGVATDPVLCAVFVGVARLLTALCMSSVFEKWGRRPAGIVSAAGMSVCMLLLALFGWYPALGQHVPLVPVISIVLHIIFSTMGLLTLPFFMISEVFPQRVRGSASGVSVCIGLLMSGAVIKLYPSMEEHWGIANVFAFYGSVSLAAVFFIYFLLPETKGRTLLEIEEYFRSGRKFSVANKVVDTHLEVEMKEVFIKN